MKKTYYTVRGPAGAPHMSMYSTPEDVATNFPETLSKPGYKIVKVEVTELVPETRTVWVEK